MSSTKREALENTSTLLSAVYANKIDLDAFMKPVQIQQECGWCDGRGYDPFDPDGEPCPECGGCKYELVTRHYLREALMIALNPAQDRPPECRWRLKRVPKWRRGGALPGEPVGVSLSLLSGGVVQNGPERSRARRCWARRSEPLTARTVLR